MMGIFSGVNTKFVSSCLEKRLSQVKCHIKALSGNGKSHFFFLSMLDRSLEIYLRNFKPYIYKFYITSDISSLFSNKVSLC